MIAFRLGILPRLSPVLAAVPIRRALRVPMATAVDERRAAAKG
jgi:hypothetical protein